MSQALSPTHGLTTEASDRIHALACALLLLLCAWLIRPYAEIGISDDFSYIRTAQILAQTGHIAYNRWASMPLGWLLYLGALCIKLFGFSFTAPRAGAFVVSLVNAYLLHRVSTYFGLTAWNATLATLTIILSPAWLMMELNFMSDAPGLFCIVFCFYACQRALLARDNGAALRWLWFAGLSNIAAGTVRQTAWLGILVILPATAWLMRRSRSIVVSGIALWVFGILSIEACLRWFERQPFSVPEKLLNGGDLLKFAETLGKSSATFLLLALPVLVAFTIAVSRLRRPQKRIAIWAVAITLVCFFVVFGIALLQADRATYQNLTPLWLPDNITYAGVKQQNEIAGHVPEFLRLFYRLAVTVCIFLATACGAVFLIFRRHCTTVAPQQNQKESLSLGDTKFLLLTFAAAYAALLVPRACTGMTFDRYLIPLILALSILALRYLQQRVGHAFYWPCWIVLFVFTGYAVAGTHDLYAFDRARVAAADEVTQSGVPRQSLEGGFEYDGWTQILTTGYIPDPSPITNAASFRRDPCRNYFYVIAPSVHPKYLISFNRSDCYQPAAFAPVPYQTWLPPHRRFVYIQRVY